VQFGLDRFHRQVRPFDDPDLDAGAPVVAAECGPSSEVFQHVVAVGQVRLQHDPRLEVMELRLVEHVGERVDSQLKIAVLLHVEIDETARLLHQRGAIDLAQRFADSFDAAIEVEHVEVGHERRRLDRNSADIPVAACRDLIDATSARRHRGSTRRGD
jgi:hypothetical protein